MACKDIDTSLTSILLSAEKVFKKESLINLDYYDGNNSEYKELITILYNATISESKIRQRAFSHLADSLFSKMPATSIYKSISFIHIDMVRRSFMTGDYKNFASLCFTDSIATRLKDESQNTNSQLANWNEVMGDFWCQYGYVSKYYFYYKESLKCLENERSEAHTMLQAQRIHEKLIYDLSPDHVNNNEFKDYYIQNLDALTRLPNYHSEEFFYHDQLLSVLFSDKLKSDTGYILPDIDDLLRNIPCQDLTIFYDVFRPAVQRRQDLELEKQYHIIWFNLVAKFNIIRWQRFDFALEKLFKVYLQLGEFENASIVNEFLGREAYRQHRQTYMDYLINPAEILLYKNELDSSEAMLDTMLARENYLTDYGQERCFRILREIAYERNDMAAYAYYDSTVRNFKWDATKDYGDIVKTTTNDIRDKKDNRLYKEITITGAVIGLILVLIFIFYRIRISQLERRRREAVARAEMEKKTLEAEKVTLELESLRTQYLTHTIGGSFKRLHNLIANGIEKNDMGRLRRSLEAIKNLNTLFNRISHNDTGEISLLDEINNSLQYVSVIAQLNGVIIACINEIPNEAIVNIKVPSFSLLDFYTNAIHHGCLLERENPKIITKILTCTKNKEYQLIIENNGISKEESAKHSNSAHESTGHRRAGRRFELYNLEKHANKLYFVATSDFIDVTDAKGKIIGVRIIIKIIHADDSD